MPGKKLSSKNKPTSALDEQIFRLMFESHSAVMLLIDPNTGKILDANLAAIAQGSLMQSDGTVIRST